MNHEFAEDEGRIVHEEAHEDHEDHEDSLHESSLSGKLRELHGQWEPHDIGGLPEKLPVARIALRADVYQARGIRSGLKHGDVNEEKVSEMRQLLRDNPEMDLRPVLVLHLPKGKRGQYILLDGHHRHRAYVGVGRSEIPVEYVRGNPTQALQAANDENTHIREPMTDEKRTQHAWRLLTSNLVDWETGKAVTHDWITKTAGVSISWVKKASMKLKEIRESDGDVPEEWRDALGWERDEDEERSKTVRRWSEDLRKGFPKMTKLGNPELFARALRRAWPEKIAEIMKHLAEREDLGKILEEAAREEVERLQEEVEELQDQIASMTEEVQKLRVRGTERPTCSGAARDAGSFGE